MIARSPGPSSSLEIMRPAACDAVTATRHSKTMLGIRTRLFAPVSEIVLQIDTHHCRALFVSAGVALDAHSVACFIPLRSNRRASDVPARVTSLADARRRITVGHLHDELDRAQAHGIAQDHVAL